MNLWVNTQLRESLLKIAKIVNILLKLTEFANTAKTALSYAEEMACSCIRIRVCRTQFHHNRLISGQIRRDVSWFEFIHFVRMGGGGVSSKYSKYWVIWMKILSWASNNKYFGKNFFFENSSRLFRCNFVGINRGIKINTCQYGYRRRLIQNWLVLSMLKLVQSPMDLTLILFRCNMRINPLPFSSDVFFSRRNYTLFASISQMLNQTKLLFFLTPFFILNRTWIV